MQYYNKYAKHPFGTTLNEEIYQTGALPSDSDFTIFKDHIPGMYTAFASKIQHRGL